MRKRKREREREVTIYIVAISEGSNSSEDINDDAENGDKRGNEAETPAYNEERIRSVTEPRSYGGSSRRLAGFFVYIGSLHLKPISPGDTPTIIHRRCDVCLVLEEEEITGKCDSFTFRSRFSFRSFLG